MVKYGLIAKEKYGIICLKMEMRTIGIYHMDRQYAEAMAQRLCTKLKEVRIAALYGPVPSEGEVYIMERYMPASKAAENISAAFGVKKQHEMEEGSKLCAFISGAGGSGTTSSAIAVGHIYTELYGFKTLYLCFDRLAVKSGLAAPDSLSNVYDMVIGQEETAGNVFARDSEGLYYMGTEGMFNPLGYLDGVMAIRLIERLSERFERIVLDIPFNWEGSSDLLDICDSIAVCFGWQQERWELSEALFGYYSGIRERIFALRTQFDEFGTDDIYGQFGSEVRALAQQIEES